MDTVCTAYYTSPLNHDFPWIMGVFSASEVHMTKIDLSALETLADKAETK